MENHYIQMENKKKITITEVTSVEGFDEMCIRDSHRIGKEEFK